MGEQSSCPIFAMSMDIVENLVSAEETTVDLTFRPDKLTFRQFLDTLRQL